MKLGVISDIHSNIFALMKVLEELKKHGVDAVINAGDNVGYSVFPDECLAMLRDEKIYNVMGNYDDAVAYERPFCGCGEGDEKTQVIRLASLRWSQMNTCENNKSFLKGLPRRLEMEFQGEKILVMHGGLIELNEFIYENETEKFKSIANNTDADIVIMGHTHIPFIVNNSGKLFVNPGSTGKPEDGNPDASYAVIDLEDYKAEIFRTSYDVEKNISFIKKAGLPEEIIENLRTGISFSEKGVGVAGVCFSGEFCSSGLAGNR